MDQVGESLLIGYGNPLRGDDGLGPAVAQLVEDLNLPNVRAMAVQQLTPELAEWLSRAGRVLFVDASAVPLSAPIVVRPLACALESSSFSHSCDPAKILGLSRLLYGRAPPAWMMAIEGSGFEPGQSLSARGRQLAAEAAGRATELLRSPGADLLLQPFE